MRIQQAIAAIPSTVTDPFFASVVNLSHFDGTNGATGPWTNSCPRGNTFTGEGTGSILSTVQKKWGTASLSNVGTGNAIALNSGDYLIGTADFTIELWTYFTVAGAFIVDMRRTITDPDITPAIYSPVAGDIRYYVNGADRITSATGVIVTNTWQFIQLARNSGVTKLYVDGTQRGSNYTDGNSYIQTSIRLGRGSFADGPMTGFIDDFRFTNGVGRANVVPTAAFPNS